MTKMTTTVHRLGRFAISIDLIHNDWRKLQKYMREVVVVAAQFDYARNEISYTAISDLFDEVPYRTQAPFYALEFTAVDVQAENGWTSRELTGDYTLTRLALA